MKDSLSFPCFISGRRRECGEQLHEYLDNHLVQGVCGSNLGVDFEAFEEVSNRLEKIGQDTCSHLRCPSLPNTLIPLNVTKMRAQRLNIGTYRE